MINIHVCCTPVFSFAENSIRGWIEIDPDSLLEAIYMNIALEYKGHHRLSVQKLISAESSNRMNNQSSPVVKLNSGIVSRNFVTMSLHEAMDLVLDYIHFDTVAIDNLISKREASLWEDVWNLKDYIYSCDECSSQDQTANICIEE